MPRRADGLACSVLLVSIAAVFCSAAGCDEASPVDGAGAGAGGASEAAGTGGQAGASTCPDPDKPGVRYFHTDSHECRAEELSACTEGETGFFTTCGCGCFPKGSDASCPEIGDTDAEFRSRDPVLCETLGFECPFGSISFRSSCGCGCLPR